MSKEPIVVELVDGNGFSLVELLVTIKSLVSVEADEEINSFSIFVVSGFKVELIDVESELPESVEIELLEDSSVEGDAVVVI